MVHTEALSIVNQTDIEKVTVYKRVVLYIMNILSYHELKGPNERS